MYPYFFLVLTLGFISPNLSFGDIVNVPIGGNSWVLGGVKEKVTDEGLVYWSSSDAILETYVRLSEPCKLKIQLLSQITGTSRIKVTVAGITKTLVWKGSTTDSYDTGEWVIAKPGYLKIELQGISRTTDTYGLPTAWQIEGANLDESAAFVKNNQDKYFYWGRRGPSVHLNYPVSENENVAWFYNEVTVPEGQDVIGSYFMANGFAEGYFGMQVNSATERRILFSVWSPYKTDDPKSIPEDQKIKLLGKGEGVYTGEFGNEGSGGQSFLRYNWQAGKTYRFLLRAKPAADSTSTFTAYFLSPEETHWRLIASFKRPHTHTYLKRLHSFLENFIPATGNNSRMVYFGNQWICNTTGLWAEIKEARFTADATARKGFRLDYAGGQEGSRFFLKNCGFFNEITQIGKIFERNSNNLPPQIEFQNLPDY